MSEFTKGKWSKLNDQRSIIVGVAMCNGEIVAMSTGSGPKELEANASLIAAAPEMYQALEYVVSNYNLQDDTDALIRILLAKARGE